MRFLISLVALTISFSAQAEWEHASELGIVIAGGNTESRTENAKHESKVKWAEKNTVKFGGSYVHSFTESDGTESDFEIWEFGARYERLIAGHVSGFIGEKVEGNRDAGFDYKASTDLGLKYEFYKDSKKDYLSSEAGYRFTYEQKVQGTEPPLERSHFVRLFLEWGKEWNDKVALKWWVEVLPDVSETENLEINTEPSLTVVLSNILSLKLGYLMKYDNQPAVSGNERIDYLYTTTLVANY